MATKFIDPVSGGAGSDGTSFANRRQSITSMTYSAGDEIRIMKSPDPTSLGMVAQWTLQSPTVTLNSAVNATVTLCESNWTASANVTCSLDAGTFRQGSNSQSIAIAAGFTTGLAAYFAISSTDYSGYQQLTFWIRSNASVAANTLRLSLCSDAVGAVQVDDFDIDFALASGKWYPVTINKGSALGATIQSVALYCQLDPGAVTILLDDILVAKAVGSADSLNLCSLISKNSGTETWWAIKSISGTTVTLDSSPSLSSFQGYDGTTESVTTYKRETTRSITTGTAHLVTTNGTSGSPITITGGWDTTAMTSQTGETWLDGRSGTGFGIDMSSNYISVDKIGLVRFNDGWYWSGTNGSGNIYGGNNCGDAGIYFLAGTDHNFTDLKGAVGNTYGVYYAASGSFGNFVNLYNCCSNSNNGIYYAGSRLLTVTGTIRACNNGGNGVLIQTGGVYFNTTSIVTNYNAGKGIDFTTTTRKSVIKNVTSSNNGTYGLGLTGNVVDVYNLTTASNTTAAIQIGGTNEIVHSLTNATMGEATKVSGFTAFLNQIVRSQNESGTVNNNVHRSDGVTLTVDTADPNTVGGLDYKIAITSANRVENHSYKFPLGPFPCNASELITIAIWAKKSHASDITARLVIPGGQIGGVATNVTTTISATSYTEYSVACTPTQKGAVTAYVEVFYSGSITDFIQIADISVT